MKLKILTTFIITGLVSPLSFATDNKCIKDGKEVKDGGDYSCFNASRQKAEKWKHCLAVEPYIL